MTTVRGLSWDHTRGHAPMVATGSAWHDRHPDVVVEWTPRTLADFAGGGLADYLGTYDLVALDHPLVGEAAEHGWLEPLESFLGTSRIRELAEETVGPSFDSYRLDGATWAAPLDAAALTAAHRPDLLDAAELPADVDALVRLAERTGRVALPLTVFGCVATYLSLCAQLGAPLERRNAADRIVDHGIGVEVIGRLQQLVEFLPAYCFDAGAVQLLGRLASGDDLAYVGYAYGYSVYGTTGYFPHRLAFGPCPPVVAGSSPRPTLGGVGLGLLAGAPRRAAAIDYLDWVTGAESQNGLFTLSGGQPARRSAWQDPLLDRIYNGFFSATGPSLEDAFVRPNAAWFGRLQPVLGTVLRDALRTGRPAGETQAALDREFERHRAAGGA